MASIFKSCICMHVAAYSLVDAARYVHISNYTCEHARCTSMHTSYNVDGRPSGIYDGNLHDDIERIAVRAIKIQHAFREAGESVHVDNSASDLKVAH